MKRPIGYALLAIFVGVTSLSGAFGVLMWPRTMGQFHIVVSPAFYVLAALQVAAGGLAAWGLWRYHRRAPEWYAAWALLALASTAYSASVIMPQMLRAVAAQMPGGFPTVALPGAVLLGQVGFFAVLHGAAYWYLVTRRRAGDGSPPAGRAAAMT